MMAIDPKRIFEKLKNGNDRGKVTLYFTKAIYKDFKKACGSHSASQVLEEMMKEFITASPKDSKIK